MTDKQAMQRYIKAFGGNLPDFNTDYWDKLNKGTQWMLKTFPNSDFSILCEKYLRACLEIATIEELIHKEGTS